MSCSCQRQVPLPFNTRTLPFQAFLFIKRPRQSQEPPQNIVISERGGNAKDEQHRKSKEECEGEGEIRKSQNPKIEKPKVDHASTWSTFRVPYSE